MQKSLALGVIVACAIAAGWWFLRPGAPVQVSTAAPAVKMPASLNAAETRGQQAFRATCAACHGEDGSGVEDTGPPLIHIYYEPSHHGDAAFILAAQRGVRAHHWRFGDMPPQPGLTRGELVDIVAFIRRVQRENGIR